jgi:competence ComEA-like helix-hairpin-helix protein
VTQQSTPQTSSPRVRRLLAGSALVLAVSIAANASVPRGQDAKPAGPAPQSPARPQIDVSPQNEEEFTRVAEAAIEKACIQCHPFENIIRMRRTVRDWNDVVTTMAGRGAIATDDQFALIRRYLTRYYGLVRVNTASAEELSAVLGLSSKDAEAIVEYRKAHGRFADIADLAKVEGLDRSKIEEQPEALRFD